MPLQVYMSTSPSPSSISRQSSTSSIQWSAEPDPISLERFDQRRAVTLNTKEYNAAHLAQMMKMGKYFVPHTRRAFTQAEVNAIMRKAGRVPLTLLQYQLKHGANRPFPKVRRFENYQSARKAYKTHKQRMAWNAPDPLITTAQGQQVQAAYTKFVNAVVEQLTRRKNVNLRVMESRPQMWDALAKYVRGLDTGVFDDLFIVPAMKQAKIPYQ